MHDSIKDRKKRAYHHSGNIEELRIHYLSTFGKSRPLLLDPFAGGGSIPYEALRQGFDVIACEYNPVAWSILQSIIEYPKKYGNLLPERVHVAFTELVGELKNKINQYYPKFGEYFISTYMYAWGVECPFCFNRVPLVNNWELKKKLVKHSKLKRFDWVYMYPTFENNELSLEIVEEMGINHPTKLMEGTVIRGKAKCMGCQNIISNRHIVEDIRQNRFEFPLVMVLIKENSNGKKYIPFSKKNIAIWEKCKEYENLIKPGILPEFSMPLKIVPAARYLDTWDQLANSRQKIFFYNFIQTALEIAERKSREWGKEWGQVIALYFALVLGKSIDFNSRCTSWASKEGIRNSLAFRRPSMVWDHCEINPFSPKGSGNLKTITNNIMNGIKQACKDLENTPGSIDIYYGSMLNMDLPQVDLIVTDPPYADDIQYPELSEFFYAWEQAILLPFFPFLPQGSPPSSEDLSVNNIDRNQEFAEFGMTMAFSKIIKLLNEGGRLSLFFAHGSLNVWNFVVNALIKSGFTITSTFPVHTESRDNVIALGKASFMTSTLIIAIVRDTNQIGYYEEIYEDIKDYATKIIKSFFDYGFYGSDLSMAALGPVLKKISEYSEIKSIKGTMKISEILSMASEIIFDLTVGSNVLASVDDITRSYLYSRLSGQKVMSHDRLQLMSKSLNVNINIIRESTIFEERRVGKHKSYFLKNYQNREIEGNSIIDQIHKGFVAYELGGNTAFWNLIKDDQHLVKEVLNLITYGIERIKLAPEVDPDTHLAKMICNING